MACDPPVSFNHRLLTPSRSVTVLLRNLRLSYDKIMLISHYTSHIYHSFSLDHVKTTLERHAGTTVFAHFTLVYIFSRRTLFL